VPLIIQLSTNEPDSEQALNAANHLLYLHKRFWPTLLLVALLIGLDSIRMSHRIAGPLFRFGRVLEEIRQGGLPRPIKLRKDDLLQDECERINEAIRALEIARREEEERGAALRASAANVRELVLNGNSALTREQTEVLGHLLEQLENNITTRGRAA
jgi:hypothetical protein